MKTANSRLHTARVCKCGSLVKLSGLTRIKHYDPHTSVNRTRHRLQQWERPCGAGLLGNQEAHPPAAVVGFNRKDVEWTKYRSNNACIGLLEGIAAHCRRLNVNPGNSWNDRPWDNNWRSALFVERSAYWPIMCVQSVPASNASERHAFIYDIVRSLGRYRIYRPISGQRDIARSVSVSRHFKPKNISAPSDWCRNVWTVQHQCRSVSRTLRHWYWTVSTSSKYFCYNRPYRRNV